MKHFLLNSAWPCLCVSVVLAGACWPVRPCQADEPAVPAAVEPPAETDPAAAAPTETHAPRTDEETAALTAEFRGAKRDIIKQLRSREPGDRISGINALAAFPTVDAVKMLQQSAFKNQPAEVRTAAMEVMLAWSKEPAIADYYLEVLGKESRRKAAGEAAYAMILALAASESAETQTKILTLLDEQMEKAKDGVVNVIALADELGERGDELALHALVGLTQLKGYKERFPVRRSVTLALTKIRRLEAVDALLKIFAEEDGEVRADVLGYLQQITRQQLPPNVKAWQDWWQENRADFIFPPLDGGVARGNLPPVAGAAYYGLPIYAKKMVFILDTSGSMSQYGRMEAAKRELLKAVRGLREGDQFSIVVYNNQVYIWQRQLVVATPENREKASMFIQYQQPRGQTATYDALEAAFGFDAEAIYLLTDGKPHSGKTDIPQEIVEVITKGNRVRRESIYVIGIFTGAKDPLAGDGEGSMFEQFLETLARQNYGTYRRVDN